MTGAHLMGADLTGADLTGVDLTGVDLAEARGLTRKQLETARNIDWSQAAKAGVKREPQGES